MSSNSIADIILRAYREARFLISQNVPETSSNRKILFEYIAPKAPRIEKVGSRQARIVKFLLDTKLLQFLRELASGSYHMIS